MSFHALPPAKPEHDFTTCSQLEEFVDTMAVVKALDSLMPKLRVFLITVAALIVPVSIGVGQDRVQVTVRGTVKSPQGTPLPGASVTVGASTVNVDAAGRFEFSGPAPPFLPLLAEHSGFELAVRVFEVRSNDVVDSDFVLVPSPDCPSGADATPPGGPLIDTDFVEIEVPSQLLSGNRVRIRADGEVLWRSAFPAHASVSKEDAHALIEKFRAGGFWSLCGAYRPASKLSISDGPLTFTTVQIANQVRRVADDYRSEPAFLRDLQRDFGTLANTERWWRTSLSSQTAPLMPNPGLTVDGVRRAFAGQGINALDSRGWTPLMYATQFPATPESVKAFLDAGASPNARSGTGETVLMIAVTAQPARPEWLRSLVAAGADVNAQDREGHTALIQAVQRFALPEGGASLEVISILLSAGASTDIRDSHGMAVLDYLEQDVRRAPKHRQENYEMLRKALAER